jgi:hypothetical protein
VLWFDPEATSFIGSQPSLRRALWHQRQTTAADVFSFTPRDIYVVGLDKQAQQLAAVTNARVVPRSFEPSLSSFAD